jgi:hypothetical protein
MPKPVLISLIPPVTIRGKNALVVANMYDDSGNFRQRNGSFKRPRWRGGTRPARDGYFDLSRDAIAPSLPTAPKLDVGRIRGLLVRANESASAIRSRITAGSATEEVKELAGLSMSLLDLVSAVVEEGILPMASSTAVSFAAAVGAPAQAVPPPGRRRVEPGTAELRAALASADKTAVVFDVDLGAAPAANRTTLNGAFSAGLKAATVKVADETGGDVNEGIRVVNDALSCADNLDFIGQSSTRKIDKRDPENPVTLPFCTMPVKLDFPDRNTRIHFEKTLRKHCGIKATISLPFQIRKYQSLFLNAMRSRYAGRIVSVRPDTANMSLVAFMKEEGDAGWSRCRESVPIPRGIMLPGFSFSNRVDLPGAADPGIGDDDEALLIAASIGAESKP